MPSIDMFLRILCVLATVHVTFGVDVGCYNNYADNFNSYGKCIPSGCCEFTAQDSSTSLCTGGGTTETCCYRDNTCAAAQNCFNVVGAWVSRYAYHGTEAEMRSGFQALKNDGVTRIYYNVWANGDFYATSATCQNADCNMYNTLGTAITVAKDLGMEIFAWYEYGNMAEYQGSNTPFFQYAKTNGWLLCNSGGSGCDYYAAGSWSYLDPTLQAVKNFLTGITRDIVTNYPALDGIQFDDHVGAPPEFDKIAAMGTTAARSAMQTLMVAIRDAARSARPGVYISYSPSPLDFSMTEHNVDWRNWLRDDVVMEVAPQYYRSTSVDFINIIDADLPRVPQYETGMVAGLRLSGSGGNTPPAEVDRMVSACYSRRLRGISFWFANDLIEGRYTPDPVNKCWD